MKHLSPDQAREIGAQLQLARAAGVKWKILAQVYNRTVRQLRRYLAGADKAPLQAMQPDCEN